MREISPERMDWWLRQIERVFQKFEDFYGSKWAAQYGDFPRERVKGTWAEELIGFIDKPEVIAMAVRAQKESPFPPTLPEFLAQCRSAASRLPSGPALPPPAPVSRDEAEKRINEIGARIGKKDPFAPSLSWAKRLRDRYLSGEKLYPVQIQMASEALGEVWLGGQINQPLEARN